jgi:threonine dehydrogenase-like Zn-dependent dehydrogenase
MLAAVFEKEGVLTLKELPLPQIRRRDEVLLRVVVASICGTDLHILDTPPKHPATPGVILGHEYIGVVEEVGKDVRHLKKGQRVVVNPNLSCQTCDYCRMGFPNLCEQITTLGIFLNGGFAEYNLAPASALYPLDKDLRSERAIFTEPVSCVLNGLKKLHLQPGVSAVVLGAGPIGLYFIKLLKIGGAKPIIVSELNKYRQKFALKCGADLVVNPIEKNLEEVVLTATPLGAKLVIDAVGSLFKTALKLVQKGGEILLFGMNTQARAEIFQNKITRHEIKIYGSFIANATFLPTLQLLKKNLTLEDLITHRFPLSKIHQGLDLMKKGEAIEVLIYP